MSIVSLLRYASSDPIGILFWLQAYALLYDSVTKEDPTIRIGAIMGLGLAYAGSQKEEVILLDCDIKCANFRHRNLFERWNSTRDTSCHFLSI